MIKTIPTIPKLLAMIGFALASFGGLLFLWLAFGGPIPLHAKGYRFYVMFPKAAQLTRQADVRISGVSVGKVVELQAVKGNATRATIELKARYAPVPKAAKAMLRTKTLLGETYVEIAPHRNARRGPLPENATLPATSVKEPVDLDELLRAFDPKTRRAFEVWMQSGAAGARGRGTDINRAFGEMPGFAEEMGELTATLQAQTSSVRRVISGTATFFDAISRRDDDLRTLMREGNKTFRAIGDRNDRLAAIFQKFPRFERESTATLPRITKLADQGLPIVRRLQSVASELTPTFRALDDLSPEMAAFMQRLGPVVTASKTGLPAFDQIMDEMPTALQAFVPFTRTLNPLLRTFDQGKQDFTAFIANLTAASQWAQYNFDSPAINGKAHALRVAMTLSPEGLGFEKRPYGQSRRNAYRAPGSMKDLATGLTSLTTQGCANGDPAPPTPANGVPAAQSALLQGYVFRTSGRDALRPPCVPQGNFPGFSTIYPQLHADPPVPVPAVSGGQKASGR